MPPMPDIQDFLVDSRKYVELYFPMTELILLLPAKKVFQVKVMSGIVSLEKPSQAIQPFR